MKRAIAVIQKKLRCPECGNVAIIHRRENRNRPNGHIKHMWCFICKKVTGHVEEGRF